MDNFWLLFPLICINFFVLGAVIRKTNILSDEYLKVGELAVFNHKKINKDIESVKDLIAATNEMIEITKIAVKQGREILNESPERKL